MLTVQTLETTSGRKWTENTANVAKRLNAQYAKCRERRLLCIFPQLSSAQLRRGIVQPFALSSTISPLRCTLALAQPLCQGLSTGVDNGGDEDEDIDSSDTLHADL